MDEDKKQIKDHREIGKEQELFFIDEQIGLGLPMWLPNGAIIRRELERYMTDLEISQGYLHVTTPHLAKLDLYKTSGHWEHYQNDMFPVMKRDNEEYVLRPMNCPHHIQIFKLRPRSYRELPMRIAEFGTLYRFENSGELSGLIRVRSMTLNDAHIFCSMDQVKSEFKKAVELIQKVYKDLNMKDYWYRLSLHDPKDKAKYVDNPQMWEKSEQALRETLDEMGLDYKEAVGEAAFYGPKLDVQIPNALGKDETVSTVQIDFSLPEKFDLKYIAEDGKEKDVVIVHRGIISTLERMVGFLAEQYQGAWPAWLSPIQVMIIPIADRHIEYGQKLLEQLKSSNIRAEVDDRSEKMQGKIRDAQLQKIPYMVIVGDKEIEDNKVAVRNRAGEDLGQMGSEEFLDKIKKEIEEKA
jgi:threonyl-tRNA synthetase